jgi:Uma2 family endonuclease
MPKTLERPATYEDLLRVPEHMVAEIIEGELFTSPRPRSRHAQTAIALSFQIYGSFSGGGSGGGWWILGEPELHLGTEVVVPDIAGWRAERMPDLTDVAFFDLAPDWVCEVISPSTARLDRYFKTKVYARHGVEYGWLVDPVQRGIEVHRLNGTHWSLIETYAGDGARIPPFEAIEIRLADLWLR